MRTIILAAGAGRRLRPLTNHIPKCLLKVGNETILSRTIRMCALTGLKNLVIITGHGTQYVEDEIKNITSAACFKQQRITYIYNPFYARFNNSYSLLLGLPKRKESIIIINSDDIFDQKILNGIVDEGPTELVVDNVKKLTEESMKVYIENNNIIRIGKWLDTRNSTGEYIGLARIAATDVCYLHNALEEIVKYNPDSFYEHALDIIAKKRTIAAWKTNGLMWTEVDTAQDLAVACELIEKELIK